MFRTEKQDFGPITRYRIRNEATGEFFEVLPEAGGCLSGLALRKGKSLRQVLAGHPSWEHFLAKKVQFRSACLFPYPGRVRDAVYTYQGQSFRLPENDGPRPHSVHGLVYDAVFDVTAIEAGRGDGMLQLELTSGRFSSVYPFGWSLSVRYIFRPGALTISTVVTNTGGERMPFGQGWHPYFTLGKPVDELELSIESTASLEFDKGYIPTGRVLKDDCYRTGGLIEDDPLHRCYVLDPSPGIHRALLSDPGEGTAVEVWQETGPGKYNFLQFYIPPDRNSLAIEPYTCPSDALNSGNNLIELGAGEAATFSMGIRLR